MQHWESMTKRSVDTGPPELGKGFLTEMLG